MVWILVCHPLQPSRCCCWNSMAGLLTQSGGSELKAREASITVQLDKGLPKHCVWPHKETQKPLKVHGPFPTPSYPFELLGLSQVEKLSLMDMLFLIVMHKIEVLKLLADLNCTDFFSRSEVKNCLDEVSDKSFPSMWRSCSWSLVPCGITRVSSVSKETSSLWRNCIKLNLSVVYACRLGI